MYKNNRKRRVRCLYSLLVQGVTVLVQMWKRAREDYVDLIILLSIASRRIASRR